MFIVCGFLEKDGVNVTFITRIGRMVPHSPGLDSNIGKSAAQKFWLY